MIQFDDGTEMSWEEAAVMVEAEGALTSGLFMDPKTGLRCAVGVFENWTKNGTYTTTRTVKNSGSFFHANDSFSGTPEARAVYMAGWLREQGA